MLTEQEVRIYSRKKNIEEGFICKVPMQVHEILVYHRKMKDPVITHRGDEAIEISRSDWIYRMEFKAPGHMEQYLLRCNGLDTIVDIYLNEKKIGSHEDMFFPFETYIVPEFRGNNVLLFHFHSPVRYLEKMEELHRGEAIPPAHYIRKAPHDYEDFLGIKPYFPLVGIFADVAVEAYDSGKFDTWEVRYSLDNEPALAVVTFHVCGQIFRAGRHHIRCVIEDSEKNIIVETRRQIITEGAFECHIETGKLKVELWWPSGYGRQILYRCKLYLEDEGVVDYSEKQIGFRKIEWKNDFELYVNDVPVKLWGANLVPLNGITHCFDRTRAEQILGLAKHANMNLLRFWGGGEPYPDELYGMADRLGIMVWGEFFHKWGMYPEEEKYMELYRQEAVYMLETFRHHPSLILWCGGNECRMGAEIDFPGQPYIGGKIFQEYEDLCKELDPEKYYLSNSPIGGAFTNDPRKGDFHGWNHLWYVPYDRYPVMFSENSRVSPPVLKSLKKYIPDPEELWPSGFQPKKTCREDGMLPPAWMKLKTGPEPYWCSPVEQFYDASNPEELVYQCQAAHGKLMKQIGERIRRGKSSSSPLGERRCKGQLIWKLNDSWPQIFCSLLDYDLEGGIPYYTVKRVLEPIHICFDIDEHITIWAVNDRKDSFEGKMEFVLFNPPENRIVHRFLREVHVDQGESVMICDIDHIGQFKRENLLYACLMNTKGEIVSRNYEFVEIERNFYFPDARLSLERKEDSLIVSTDKFARCIELRADSEQENDKFVFEDNYFDLLPFEKRSIRVYSGAKQFRVMAKPFYSTQEEIIEFIKEDVNEI